ncbi:MAG: BamA/TamA family outer membrane protein, partial [Pyrinomonadaceae bacterium]
SVAAGNRQRSFVFSFTEPYVRNRQITAGFSVFTQSLKFFGEGTFLSQNLAAQQGLAGSQIDFLNTGDENLFTQVSTGGSLFLTAPLAEFYRKRPFTLSTRLGLTYSFSRTSVKDPEINADPNNPNFIPVIYEQPNIITSRITPTAVYDTRDLRGVDAVRGRQVTLQLAFAGLGGDVRTIQPSLSFQQFIPVRRKRATIPEVFGFRLLLGHVGSFATTEKVRQAQQSSLSFIGGVPVFERFFLGDEFTIRGYNVRSISPIVPLELFVTSQNVVVAANPTGTPVPIEGLQQFASLGTFTGPNGPNPRVLSTGFQPIGADTQLLGNFEYRVPIFGPVSAAAFADIGSAFNIRKGSDQIFSTTFNDDQPFLQRLGSLSSLSALALQANPNLAFNVAVVGNSLQLGLVGRDNRVVTAEELANGRAISPVDPNTNLPFGFYQVYLRGQAQTNTAVRLSRAAFNKIGDIRSSLGVEFRVQLPVVNVPFRLIYAYNPNARTGLSDEVPLVFNEKRSVFRFSIGRTF